MTGPGKKKSYSPPTATKVNPQQARQFVMNHTNWNEQEAEDFLESVRYYVSRWRNNQDPGKREFIFDDNPAAALPCDTREKAERLRLTLNRAAIQVRLFNGGNHVCGGFEVAEVPSRRPPSKKDFVVCFRAPRPIAAVVQSRKS